MQQKPAIIFLVLALSLGAWWLVSRPNPLGAALKIRELAARGLAEELARTQSAGRVLVLSNPFTQSADTQKTILEMEHAGLAGLRHGLGAKLSIGAVVFPELLPEARENPSALLQGIETTTPLSYLVAPESIDRLARQHADCGIVVSLIGLPAELSRCESWTAAGGPKFALLLPDFRGILDGAGVVLAMKSGKLLAFVLPKPGAPDSSGKLSGDRAEEFQKRFVLVTPANVEQVVRDRPALF